MIVCAFNSSGISVVIGCCGFDCFHSNAVLVPLIVLEVLWFWRVFSFRFVFDSLSVLCFLWSWTSCIGSYFLLCFGYFDGIAVLVKSMVSVIR